MVITSSTRSILSGALIALTGPLPIHKSESVLRAEHMAELRAKREQHRREARESFDDMPKLAKHPHKVFLKRAKIGKTCTEHLRIAP